MHVLCKWHYLHVTLHIFVIEKSPDTLFTLFLYYYFVKSKMIIIEYKLPVCVCFFLFDVLKSLGILSDSYLKYYDSGCVSRSISHLSSWGICLLRKREDKNIIVVVKSWCGVIKKW